MDFVILRDIYHSVNLDGWDVEELVSLVVEPEKLCVTFELMMYMGHRSMHAHYMCTL